jgi:autotransporter translocation and assembly factor TamB
MLAGSALLEDGLHLTLRRLHLQRGDLVWQNVGPIEVVRSLQGVLQLQRLVLRSGTQEISARGRLNPEGPVQAEVHVQQLRIQPTVQAVAPETPAPEGRLSLDLTIDGTLDQPRAQGNLDVTALAWQDHALGDIHADLTLRHQVLRPDLRWQLQGQQLLQVRGTLGLSTDDRLALQTQASAIDLALLEPLNPAITHSSGTLRFDLEFSGRLQQPQVYGSLQLADGALQLAPTGERYRNLEARLTFAGDRIEIERLHVGSQSGPLQLTGRIEHTGLSLERINLVMRAQEFTAMHTPAIQTVISAEIAIRGSLQELVATGNVTVPRGRVLLDELP